MKAILFLSALMSSVFAVAATDSSSFQRRCGWLDNPSPANYYFTDRDGSFSMAEQGGHEAIGMDRLPRVNYSEFVRRNGNYGYYCACVVMSVDIDNRRVLEVRGGKQLPLKTCLEDATLPSP